jgi:hypothetical protein
MPSWESDAGIGQFLWLPACMRNGSEMRMRTHSYRLQRRIWWR